MLLKNSLAQKSRNQPSCTRPVSLHPMDLDKETLSVKDGPHKETVDRVESVIASDHESGNISTKISTGK